MEAETREVPIEHGTVLNLSFGKNQPPILMNALDSLLSFPSIQRYQKRNSDVVDQNSNQIRLVLFDCKVGEKIKIIRGTVGILNNSE